MKTRLISIMTALFLLSGLASAQGYDIRTTGRNNLRAAPSLDGTFVETVPPGTVLHVIGMSGRWLRINRNGRDVWMADWLGYTRIESNVPTASQPASNIDNCCFVDRQCQTDQEWTAGYHAFQNGQCSAPAQSQQQTPTQPVSNVPAQVDNCCFVNRQCNTNQQWEDGFWAFQNGQCPAPAQTQTQTSTQPVTTSLHSYANCCFLDRQCTTDKEWEEGWYAWGRLECTSLIDNCCQIGWECHTEADWQIGAGAFGALGCYTEEGSIQEYARTHLAAVYAARTTTAPVQSQQQVSTQPVSNVPAQVDNCCFVDRQCNTPADWENGYYAFRDNQCGAQTQPSSQRTSVGVPDGINNCCRAGWHCETELDWQRGWAAYKLFQCSDEIPMRIKGSSTFVNLVREAYNRLKRTSPRLYIYGVTGFKSIREAPADGDTGFFDDDKIYQQAFGRGSYTDYDVVAVVGGIAHEACHAHQLADGTATSGWRNELPCMQKELEAYRAVDPTDRYGFIAWAQDIVDNIRNPDYWWWD